MDEKLALIEEYKSLREEIMRRQYARLLILGYTVTAVGALLGLAARDASSAAQSLTYYRFVLLAFALLILIAALLMTINHTQQIDIIASYIRRFIEPRVNGIRWESRWMRYRQSKLSPAKITALPLGTSKSLSLYYALLTVGTSFTAVIFKVYEHLLALVIIAFLAFACLIWSCDLSLRISKGWKMNWDGVD